MRPTVFRVGTPELVEAFVEQKLASLVSNVEGAVLEFRLYDTDAKFEDDSRSVKHIMVVATVYWETLVAYLRKRSQPMSREISNLDDRQLKIGDDIADSTVQVKFDCHRPSNLVEAVRLYYAGNATFADLRRNPAWA